MPSTCFHEGRQEWLLQPEHVGIAFDCQNAPEIFVHLLHMKLTNLQSVILRLTTAQRRTRQLEQYAEAKATLASNRGLKTHGLQLLQLTRLRRLQPVIVWLTPPSPSFKGMVTCSPRRGPLRRPASP